MSAVDPEIVKEFFLKLRSAVDDGGLDGETIKLIKKHPNLLKCECPAYEDDEDDDNDNDEEVDMREWDGFSAIECLCEEQQSAMPGAREVLLELLEAGAVATDDCYNMIGDQGALNGYYTVLLLTGHMPLKMQNGKYFLDEMTKQCQANECPDTLEDCTKLLHPKQVKTGDDFHSFSGEIKGYMVDNLQKLPTLKAGVTHKEGGPFEKHLKEWMKTNVLQDEKKEDDEEGEAPKEKKQKTSD